MRNTNQQSILVVGAGNMGQSIVKGLLAKQWPANEITFCDNQVLRHVSLQNEFPGCCIISNPYEISNIPKVILLAVKPHDMPIVCRSIAESKLFSSCLFITVAAGIPINTYLRWLGDDAIIVRCMPNTPAAIGHAITGLYTASSTSDEDKSLASHILSAIGETLWLDEESKLDAVTALSGSGPAYLFYIMECLQKSGQKLGLNKEHSYKLVLQTMLGAAQLAAQQDIDFKTLRANVTSKGGTTEQAINCLTDNNLAKIIDQTISAAANRSHEISQSFDEE